MIKDETFSETDKLYVSPLLFSSSVTTHQTHTFKTEQMINDAMVGKTIESNEVLERMKYTFWKYSQTYVQLSKISKQDISCLKILHNI